MTPDRTDLVRRLRESAAILEANHWPIAAKEMCEAATALTPASDPAGDAPVAWQYRDCWKDHWSTCNERPHESSNRKIRPLFTADQLASRERAAEERGREEVERIRKWANEMIGDAAARECTAEERGRLAGLEEAASLVIARKKEIEKEAYQDFPPDEQKLFAATKLKLAWQAINALSTQGGRATESAAPGPQDISADLVRMVTTDNRALKVAGDNLAVAATFVTQFYDGTHRLRLAIAAWQKANADEGGRGERYAAGRTDVEVRQMPSELSDDARYKAEVDRVNRTTDREMRAATPASSNPALSAGRKEDGR